MTLYPMILDILLATLLLIAIIYCWRLDGRLKAMRKGGDAMLEAARELQTSIVQAQAAIDGLRRSADASGRELQLKIDEARALGQGAGVAGSVVRERPAQETALRRRSS
jgi:hypothetical protein